MKITFSSVTVEHLEQVTQFYFDHDCWQKSWVCGTLSSSVTVEQLEDVS